MSPIWVAFCVGCFIGCVIGIFTLSLVSINRCHNCNNSDDGPGDHGLYL